MGAPLGNQYAVGHGRPPNEGFSDPELILLGQELLDWCKLMDSSNVEIVHLSEWYSEVKEIHYSQWKSIINRECFLPYYERALKWMGKRILKNDRMPSAYGSRYLGMYHKDLREHERNIAKEKVQDETEIRAAQDANKKVSPNQSENDYIIKIAKLTEERDHFKRQAESIHSPSQ